MHGKSQIHSKNKISKVFHTNVTVENLKFFFPYNSKNLEIKWKRGDKREGKIFVEENIDYTKKEIFSNNDDPNQTENSPQQTEQNITKFEFLNKPSFSFKGTFFFELKKNTCLRKPLQFLFIGIDASSEINMGKILQWDSDSSQVTKYTAEVKLQKKGLDIQTTDVVEKKPQQLAVVVGYIDLIFSFAPSSSPSHEEEASMMVLKP